MLSYFAFRKVLDLNIDFGQYNILVNNTFQKHRMHPEGVIHYFVKYTQI